MITSLAAPGNAPSVSVGAIIGTSRALPIVASRAPSFQFAGSDLSLGEIGEKLNVNYLIEGSVRKLGGTARVTAQVVRPEDGQQVWSKTYEVDLGGDFDLQAGIAEHVAHIASNVMAIDLGRHFRERLNQLAFLTGFDRFESIEQSILANIEYFTIRLGEGGWRLACIRTALEESC